MKLTKFSLIFASFFILYKQDITATATYTTGGDPPCTVTVVDGDEKSCLTFKERITRRG